VKSRSTLLTKPHHRGAALPRRGVEQRQLARAYEPGDQWFESARRKSWEPFVVSSPTTNGSIHFIGADESTYQFQTMAGDFKTLLAKHLHQVRIEFVEQGGIVG
jgi:hypothetical protein